VAFRREKKTRASVFVVARRATSPAPFSHRNAATHSSITWRRVP
jgi:hypothetical protein